MRLTAADDFLTVPRLGWLLLVLALVAAPQLMHTSPWIGTVAAGLGVWRYLAARRGWRLPPPWLRLSLALAGFAGVLATYRGINGVEPGSALLTLMLALKLTETWRRRDCLLLIYLGYFLILAQFLYEQSIGVTLYLIPVTWLLTAVLLDFAHPGGAFRPRAALRLAGRYLLAALPLMLILFLLFPRIPGPLWGVSSARGEAVSGLDDEMTPGSISELILSEEVAFRVRFEGAPPPPEDRYWRGPVLHHFDGRSWRQGWPLPPAESPPQGTAAVRYSVTLEPHERHWLYALDLPGRIPEDAVLRQDYQLLSKRPVRERRRYELLSFTRYQAGLPLPDFLRWRSLQLPEGFNPRARTLAEEWRASLADERAVVRQALRMFREQPFVYTLQPPLLGRHSVDEFLFETRRGFCEHYAGSFVFLMRAAGIPARVVTGYLGGSPNPLADYFIVRQSDAHAWAEVWLPDAGWVRVDPTAAVAPERIELGLAGALSETEARLSGLLGAGDLQVQLEIIWETINARWNEWVLGYGPELQRRFLEFAGIENPSWRKLALVLTAVFVAAGALFMAWFAWRNRRAPVPPLLRHYRRLCRALARQGVARRPQEGPADFAARAAAALPAHAPAIRDAMRRYIRLRYAEAGDAAAVQAFGRRIRRLVRKLRADR